MKVKSILKDNFLTIYSEARSVARHKNIILKRKKLNHLDLLEEITLYYSILLLLGIFAITNNSILDLYGYILIFTGFIYLIYNSYRIYKGYIFRKKQNFISEIIIDEKGITDTSSFKGMELLFKWEIIEGIIIKKHTVVILTERKIYFYFDIKDKEKIINEIKKHKKKIKIIEK